MFDLTAMRAALEREVVGWSADQLAAALRELAELRRRLDACEARVLAAFVAVRAHGHTGAADTAAWLRTETGVSHRDAARRVARAKDLAAVPAVAAGLAAGVLTTEHAASLARAARRDAGVRQHVDELVHQAGAVPADRFAKDLRTWVRDHSPDGGAARFLRQHEARRVHDFTDDDGMTALDVRLDPVAGATVLAAIDDVAEELWRADDPDGTGRSARALERRVRRADALVEICRRARCPEGSTRRGPPSPT